MQVAVQQLTGGSMRNDGMLSRSLRSNRMSEPDISAPAFPEPNGFLTAGSVGRGAASGSTAASASSVGRGEEVGDLMCCVDANNCGVVDLASDVFRMNDPDPC